MIIYISFNTFIFLLTIHFFKSTLLDDNKRGAGDSAG